jgi:hypothetical protein
LDFVRAPERLMLRNLFCVVFAGLMLAACGSTLPLKDIPSGATLGVADPWASPIR